MEQSNLGEIDMYTEMIKDKLFEQSEVYQMLKNGETVSVQYRTYKDKKWGTGDANYLNRMRLAYYLLYAQIDDEDAIVYLFQEELKDRKTNSFQGIGNTLNVLTFLLKQYNTNNKYNYMFEEAKNANFDCACGYDKEYWIDNKLDSLNLMECIYLSQDLEYRDVMDILVGKWKESITEWNDINRNTLIRFNSFLGKEQENETIYKVLLDNAIISGKTYNIVSAYTTMIRFYIDSRQLKIATTYLIKMINTTDFKDVERIRLFGDVLEECFEVICGGVKESIELWKWSKPYLKRKASMYGNLYEKGIAAAKAVGDSYAAQLEQEYIGWKKEIGLK